MQWFAKTLLQWFDKHGRKNLPWQENINSYRVWISEIMLQQTQVATVIPYFQKFMQRFPDVKALAEASEDDVLHYWTGLGYYSRARNLHKAAKIIQHQFNGKFPDNIELAQSLPGIGRSTAGAILSITRKQPTPILEGNVKRVLTRFYAIEGWPGKTEVQQQLWKIATKNMPEIRTADYTQAIMDLGATVCIRSNPLCNSCPFNKKCQAFIYGRQKDFPEKNPNKKKLPVRQTFMLLIQNLHDALLMEKRPSRGIWGGLWGFPECSRDTDIKQWCQLKGFAIKHMQIWSTFRHTFSHYHLDITPVFVQLVKEPLKIMEPNSQVWYNPDQPPMGGFATPVKKLLLEIVKRHCRESGNPEKYYQDYHVKKNLLSET